VIEPRTNRLTETLALKNLSKSMTYQSKSRCVIVRVIESLYHYDTNWVRGMKSLLKVNQFTVSLHVRIQAYL